MVIANNEWHNNYEDEQKPAQRATTSNTEQNSTSTAQSTSAATTTGGSKITRTDIQNISKTNTKATATATATAAGINVIFDNSNSIGRRKFSKRQQQYLMIKTNAKIMDDTSNNPEQEFNENENNNQRELLNETSIGSNHHNSNSNSIPNSSSLLSSLVGCTNSVVPIGSNSNTNSNQNTVVVASTSTVAITTSSPPAYNSAPITPQALSNALQSALNATTNNVTVAGGSSSNVGNLQNNFLNSLGVGVSPNATLQHTANLAKQLSSSLSALESQTNLNNSTLDNNSTVTDIMVRAVTVGAAADQHQQALLENNGQAKIILHCEPNSHPFQARTILLTPNIECKVGRLIAKSKASESNAIFDCKVLSRNHAVLWYSNDGKFWVKDTKSSNGTFINENKLGNEAAELHFGDVVKFGVDVLENSRKEVHGCIIAGVKLYLPDGRETISIESSSQLSPHSGEGRISFDELHRLNLYMQEASQREKVLKSKLFNIQNMLDATRKNSALCWQSMVAEDQLLHRIHSLEKKLQLMEKNVPENVLRNEVIKLLDDKNLYQHSAKEALRKVYQERCDAMQLLSKMEAAYTTSDNECKLLRDQIMNTKESLQDVNARLLSLETEYNEYKVETERQHLEAKEKAEQQTAELEEKLRERELQCEELRRKISELLLKRADLLDEEKLQQKLAIEKLDAAIADMDLGDDDDDDEDEDDANDDYDENIKPNKEKADINGDSMIKTVGENNIKEEKIDINVLKPCNEPQEGTKQKSTILKWLENSDLNKKEGSLDIFEAICNESDSSDEEDDNTAPAVKSVNNNKLSTNISNKTEDFESKCTKFNSKLQTVQKNLSQLEAEIANETNKTENVIASLDDGSRKFAEDEECEDSDDEDDDVSEENEVVKKLYGKSNNVSKSTAAESPTSTSTIISKDNKSYILLKKSVYMLREAYNEICDNMKQQQNKQQTPPPSISVQTQFQSYADHSGSNSALKKLEKHVNVKTPPSGVTSISYESDEENDAELNAYDDINSSSESDEVKSSAHTIRSSTTSLQTIKEVEEHNTAVTLPSMSTECQRKIELEIKSYQDRIDRLTEQLEQHENDAQNTLEIMQIESDAFKDKVSELTKLVDTLRDEKRALEQVISENKSNVQKTAECCKDELVISEQLLLLEAKEARQEKECNLSPPKEQNIVPTSEKTIDNDENDEQQEQEKPDDDVEAADIIAEKDKHNAFEKQIREELAAINNTAVQREEELIIYKERLELTRSDNLKLQQEIHELQLKANNHAQTLIKRMLPYGVVAVAILVYFIVTYF